jgi:uncharacterized membrane protein (DUF485 family)
MAVDHALIAALPVQWAIMQERERRTSVELAGGQQRDMFWHSVARSREFHNLVRAKMRFIVPASVFFILYYFALPVLVGYFPSMMERRVIGSINLAYLFALSQFIMAWTIMWLYVRQARKWDAMEHEIIERVHHGGHGEHGGAQR